LVDEALPTLALPEGGKFIVFGLTVTCNEEEAVFGNSAEF
jgi:hypothetical protein